MVRAVSAYWRTTKTSNKRKDDIMEMTPFVTATESQTRKPLGIVSPVRAQDTGLIPKDWTVEADVPEGEINLAELDYSLDRFQLARAFGSLGLAVELLKVQRAGKEIFPVESRGQHYFFMPRTILLDGKGNRYIPYFAWNGGSKQWVLNFSKHHSLFLSVARFIGPPRK